MIPLAFRPLPSPGLAALPAAACRRARALAAVVAAAAGGSRPRNQKRKLAAAAEPASIHLVWDLDNMRPGRGLKAAGVPRVISGLLPALRQLLAEEGGPAAAAADSTNATQVTAYANKDSLQDLGGAAAVEDALARVGGRLVVAPYGP